MKMLIAAREAVTVFLRSGQMAQCVRVLAVQARDHEFKSPACAEEVGNDCDGSQWQTGGSSCLGLLVTSWAAGSMETLSQENKAESHRSRTHGGLLRVQGGVQFCSFVEHSPESF